MFEFVLEFIFWGLHLLLYCVIGAPVGLLYPPKSPDWAFRQKVGWIFGATALACLVIAIVAGVVFNAPTATWSAAAVGLLAFVAFSIIGNASRVAHERKR